MNAEREPRRWYLADDTVPDRLRQLVNVARSDLPSLNVVRAMEVGVASRLAEFSEDLAVPSTALTRSVGHVAAETVAVGFGPRGCTITGNGSAPDAIGPDDTRERSSDERSSIRRRARTRHDPGSRSPK